VFDHGGNISTITDPEFQTLIDGVATMARPTRWDMPGVIARGRAEYDTGRPRCWITGIERVAKTLAQGLKIIWAACVPCSWVGLENIYPHF